MVKRSYQFLVDKNVAKALDSGDELTEVRQIDEDDLVLHLD